MRLSLSHLLALACAIAVAISLEAQSTHSVSTPLKADADRLIKAATADDFAWRRLAELTDTFGARLSGSQNLARAIRWSVQTMKADGLENVHTEPVMVPQWVRGREAGGDRRSAAARPGDSRARRNGVDAARWPRGRCARGQQLRRSPQSRVRGARQDRAVRRRRTAATRRPSRTATAVRAPRRSRAPLAVLVRSVGPVGLRTTHTGSVNYVPDVTADSRGGDRSRGRQPPRASRAHRPPRASAASARRAPRSRRRVGQRRRRDHRTREAERDRAARRASRFVGRRHGRVGRWRRMHHHVGGAAPDEEAGLRRAARCAWCCGRTRRTDCAARQRTPRRHASTASDHVFALESDLGVFAPAALGFSGSMAARAMIGQIGRCSSRSNFPEITAGGGGADIGPIAQAGSVPTMAYLGDAARYFVIHHTAADTVERILPEEVSRAAAAIAVDGVRGRGDAGEASVGNAPELAAKLANLGERDVEDARPDAARAATAPGSGSDRSLRRSSARRRRPRHEQADRAAHAEEARGRNGERARHHFLDDRSAKAERVEPSVEHAHEDRTSRSRASWPAPRAGWPARGVTSRRRSAAGCAAPRRGRAASAAFRTR